MERLCERLRSRLLRDMEDGRVDPDVVPLLSLLWSRGYCTSSSCSGRIVVKSGPALWTKPGVSILASWHLEPPPPRLVYYRALSGGPYSWVSAEPPIIALYADSLEAAEAIVEAALRAGFKYAGFRPSSSGYYVVIRGEERMDTMIVAEGEPVVTLEGFERVYPLLLRVWRRGKQRLAKLREMLESS